MNTTPFCQTPLWNVYTTWYTDFPRFTSCFEDTVLTFVPAVYLLIAAPFAVCGAADREVKTSLPLTFFNLAKYVCTSTLVGLFLASVVLQEVRLSALTSAVVADIVNVVVYLLVLGLQILCQKQHVRSSASLFGFWFLTLISYLPKYYNVIASSAVEDYPDPTSSWDFCKEVVVFTIVLTEFALTFFVDSTPEQCDVFENATTFSWLVFGWITPLIARGYKKLITIDDLFPVPKFLKSEEAFKFWGSPWKKAMGRLLARESQDLESSFQEPTKKFSLTFLVFKIFWKPLVFAVLLDMCKSTCVMLSALLLNLILDHVSSTEPLWKGVIFCVAIFCANSASTVFSRHANYTGNVCGLKSKSMLISAVYKKAQIISNESQGRYTVGELVNLISVDVEKFYRLMSVTPFTAGSPYNILVVMILLWQYLGPSCLAGILVLICLMPISGIVAKMTKALQASQMKLKDSRLKNMNEILNSIKILKLFAWEPPFMASIENIRFKEVEFLKKIAYLNAGIGFFWTCTPAMVSLASFVAFVLASEDNILTPATAFVSLTLFNQIRFSMIIIPDFISNFVQTEVSLTRIRDFLFSEELSSYSVGYSPAKDCILSLDDVSASWNRYGDNVLKDINLSVKAGQLIAVVGQVGTGKSSLLSTILGNLYVRQGRIDLKGSVAYVPQQAWIQNITVKKNILFTSPWNAALYEVILDACCLHQDLELLAMGDHTEIGERGINLSGGQKQRISLARAVYQDRDVYLLDDPLSAVDAHVGAALFSNVIGPGGILQHKTRILVTNNLSVLPNTDMIIVLKDGCIVESGDYSSLMKAGGNFSELMSEYVGDSNSEKREQVRVHSRVYIRTVSEFVRDTEKSTAELLSETTDITRYNLTGEERVEVGIVKWKVYLIYLKNMGFIFFLLILLFYGAYRGMDLGSGLWLSEWSNDQPLPNGRQDIPLRNLRLGVYAVFGLSQGLFSFLAQGVLAYGTVTASRRLHNRMLNSVLRAPMVFFDTTPIGRLLNRFSKDIDQLDIQLPQVSNLFLDFCTQIIGMLILISVNLPIFLAIAAPVIFIYWLLQHIFLRTVRPLKRIESITRSPVYSHFSESVQGLDSIRAYNVAETFTKVFQKKVDISQNCTYLLMVCQRWMTVRLEFLGQILTFFTTLMVVLNRDTMDAGLAGLMISYSLSSIIAFAYFVQFATEVETAIVAAERIDEYTHVESEGTWNVMPAPPSDWPQDGKVVFKCYSTRYRENLEPVLRNIDLEVSPSEKIGIVGRTGAGKSTITLALFRVLEATSGQIIVDDIDISKIGLHDLRSRLTIIPQDPVLFNGTLRYNLDPIDEHQDDELRLALQKAGTTHHFPQGLSTVITEGGQNLSVGQRQLVCLCRAILRRSKIIVLDEATAAVDLETDSLIQETIRKNFSKSTILTVAHRIHTILDSDRVVVMSSGRIREVGKPQELLKDESSLFYLMAKEAGVVNEIENFSDS